MCQHLCVICQQWFHSPASREHKVLGLIPIGTNMSPITPSVWQPVSCNHVLNGAPVGNCTESQCKCPDCLMNEEMSNKSMN